MKITVSIAYIAVALASFMSCEDDLGEVGLDLIDNDRFVDMNVDSVSDLKFITLRDTYIDTSFVNPMLGSYIDPVFGTTSSEFIAPFYMSTASIPSDSVSFYINDPKTTVTLSFKIGKTNDTKLHYGIFQSSVLLNIYILDKSNATLENDDPANAIDLIDEDVNPFLLSRAFTVQRSDTANRIRLDTINIELSIEEKKLLLTKVLTGYAYSNKVGIDTVNNFMHINSFPGLHFTFDKSQIDGSIICLDDITINIKRNKTAMELTTQGEEINIFKHNYNEATFKLNDTIINKVFIQPLQGIKTRIKLPSLNNWIDSTNLIFNRVVLKLPIDCDTTKFPPPRQLTLGIIGYGADSTLDTTVINSINIHNSTYDKVTRDDNGLNYTFFLTDFITTFYYNKMLYPYFKDITLDDYTFELTSIYNNAYPQRAVMDLGSDGKKATLEIVYTKY